MPDEKFAYAVREATVDGVTRYYAAFIDGEGNPQETEIPHGVYLTFDQSRLIEKRQENEFRRHRERFALSEAQLAVRTLRPPLPMEDAVAQAADMQAALATLTDAQRRRFMLYHEHGLSLEQIAQAENRAVTAIVQSVVAATEKMKIFFEGTCKKGGLSEE